MISFQIERNAGGLATLPLLEVSWRCWSLQRNAGDLATM